MLHFLYRKDWTKYPDERQRVQQVFLMIVHAYSGLRSSSTTKSSIGETDENGQEAEKLAKLRFGTFTLVLTEDERGRARLAVVRCLHASKVRSGGHSGEVFSFQSCLANRRRNR